MTATTDGGAASQAPVLPADSGEFVSVADAAKLLGITTRAVQLRFDRGALVGVRDNTDNTRWIRLDTITEAPPGPHVGTSEAAHRLDLDTRTVRRLHDEGHLDGYRTPSGARRISIASIEDELRRRRADEGHGRRRLHSAG